MLLFPLLASLPAAAVADPRLAHGRPLLRFESDYHAAFTARDEQSRLDAGLEDDDCSAAINPPASPLDLRIAKAHAAHGYDAVRISVVTYSPDPPAFVRKADDEPLEWDYSGKFRYRWTAQFDTGKPNRRCADVVGNGTEAPSPLIERTNYTWGGFHESPTPDEACLFACQDKEECRHYSFWYNSTSSKCVCELFASCECAPPAVAVGDANDAEDGVWPDEDVGDGWTTTSKYGDSYMHTRVTKVVPGEKNGFSVDGNDFDVKIPEEGKKAKCIVWGDPCISSMFVGCSFGKYFNAYEKSVDMLNALAEDDSDGGFDCFILLGDNFYDGDGRVSVSFWKRLSIKAMSKVFVAVLGNHDIWTGGAPSAANKYDSLQYNLQYFGLDTVAGLEPNSTGSWINYSIDPDDPPASLGEKYVNITATSSITNSISWFKFGGFGILFFNGAYDAAELAPYFDAACAFFDENVGEEETIVLIGHWNGNATEYAWILPYGGQLVTPDARKLLLQTPGCSRFGNRIIYFDGHSHANSPVEVDNGYLMGGHGILGVNPENMSVPNAAEYGSFYVQSSPTTIHYCLEVHSNNLSDSTATFDPSTIHSEKYFEILACLGEKSVHECETSLCQPWPYFGSVDSSVPTSANTTVQDPATTTPDDSGAGATNTQIMLCFTSLVLATIGALVF